jgi:hypothetical protein
MYVVPRRINFAVPDPGVMFVEYVAAVIDVVACIIQAPTAAPPARIDTGEPPAEPIPLGIAFAFARRFNVAASSRLNPYRFVVIA